MQQELYCYAVSNSFFFGIPVYIKFNGILEADQ